MDRLIAILALALAASAQEPPPDLVKRIAAQEAKNDAARSQYLYRQTVTMDEIQPKGGSYKEVREVIFSPTGERTEQEQGKSRNTLQRLILTPEDFEDLRNIQPILLTPDMLPRYQTKFRGDETIDGMDCWVLDVSPKQIFPGFRMFEGTLWADKQTLSIVRINGQAVPPIYAGGRENLFPRFTTIREKIDGEHWFPTVTHSDDTLPFKSGPLRIRMMIRYENYKRFGADTKITFDPPK